MILAGQSLQLQPHPWSVTLIKGHKVIITDQVTDQVTDAFTSSPTVSVVAYFPTLKIAQDKKP